MATAVLTQSADEVGRRDIAFLRLYIAESIEGQQLHTPRQIAVALDNVFHAATMDEVVVRLLCCLHLHSKALTVR